MAESGWSAPNGFFALRKSLRLLRSANKLLAASRTDGMDSLSAANGFVLTAWSSPSSLRASLVVLPTKSESPLGDIASTTPKSSDGLYISAAMRFLKEGG